MRIRSIVPKFWRSDDIDSLDWDSRLVFIGLWSYVDDNGVGLDKLSSITADLFAHDFSVDPTETLRRVSLALDRLSLRGMLTRYSADEKRFLFVNQWDQYQKPKNPAQPRYPRPTSINTGSPETLRTSSVEPTESLPTGEGEKGRRGEGEEKTCPAELDEKPAPSPKYSADFLDWYEHYPRREAKGAAYVAFKKALKRGSLDELIAGADRYTADPNRLDEYTKMPATWLNQDCWLDGPLPPRGGTHHHHHDPSRSEWDSLRAQDDQRQIGA